MKLRHAAKNDLPKLIPLFSELGYPCSLEYLTLRFEKFLNNSGNGVVVSELNQEIVGWVAWSCTPLFVSNATRFRIEGLVVASSFKGKGIGKSLMKFVEEIAARSRPAIIDLTSGIRRASDGSHEFYKHLGYDNEGHMAKLYLRKTL